MARDTALIAFAQAALHTLRVQSGELVFGRVLELNDEAALNLIRRSAKDCGLLPAEAGVSDA